MLRAFIPERQTRRTAAFRAMSTESAADLSRRPRHQPSAVGCCFRRQPVAGAGVGIDRFTLIEMEMMFMTAGRGFMIAAVLAGISAPVAAQQSRCPEPDTASAWVRVLMSWERETGLTWTNDSLRGVLVEMLRADQAERVDFGAKFSDPAFARRLLVADSLRSAELERILDRFGLPTRSMVGAKGADAVMLLVQHSAWLQPRVFALASAAPAGEVSAEKLAMMDDRIRVAHGQPQRYGTQFNAANGGLFRFAPVEDLAGLEARRARVGIAPLRDYVCYMKESGMKIDHSTLPPARPPGGPF
jgi:hypothetical protein